MFVSVFLFSFFFFLMIRRPPRSTLSSSSAASDVYKRQVSTQSTGKGLMAMDGGRSWYWQRGVREPRPPDQRRRAPEYQRSVPDQRRQERALNLRLVRDAKAAEQAANRARKLSLQRRPKSAPWLPCTQENGHKMTKTNQVGPDPTQCSAGSGGENLVKRAGRLEQHQAGQAHGTPA
eukprot:TRINITY_DN27536_c0_g1_i1.p1 TRINITY_DN27536_c0_g1~~TRINITY_DN27536_c0_g1_i1.p1  ORF type:complete len:177 (+),score=39.94 TRINITY_DN27536_c0_g1_i1:72-602(+)